MPDFTLCEITFKFDDGATYTYFEEDPERLELGSWDAPFPNAPGNSTAFGLSESLEQSDLGAPLVAAHGKVVQVSVRKF